MKRILTAMLCIAMLALTTACDKSPAFEFRMNLSGSITEATTNISTDLAINAANVTDSLAFCNAENYALPLNIKAGRRANHYLDEFVNQRILKNLNNGALYDISADGYITEKTTGLTFKKRWTNKSDIPDILVATNSANTALTTYTTMHCYGVL